MKSDDGTEVALIQEAYCDQDFAAPGQPMVYRAKGLDAVGNVYAVQWALKAAVASLPEDERPEDESDYCDWDSPKSVELIETA